MEKEYKEARESGIYYFISTLTLLKLNGIDAGSYINSQTCNNVLDLEDKKGLANALLDRKAHLIATFTIHKFENSFFVFSENRQSEKLMDHLEKFHFTEDFEFENISNNYTFISIQGKKSFELVKKLFSLEIKTYNENDLMYCDENLNYILVAKNQTGDGGFVLAVLNNIFETRKTEILNLLSEYNFKIPSDDLLKTLRVEAGIPEYFVDMDETNLLPETGLEKNHVSYNKGCYLGQEVVARIRTYGTTPKALIGLIFEEESPNFNDKIFINNKEVGIIKSNTYSPFISKNIALAYLHKEFRNPDEDITFIANNKEYKAKVKLLPFYEKLSPEEEAKNLYEKALSLFAENEEEEAVVLLKKAIELHTDFPDAYESLGVILSRLEKYEEAIEIMNKLTQIAPEEPMARTNLSIFYMKIGNKEEAEKQMALATTLKFKKTMIENKHKKVLEEQKRKETEVILERMEMFKEVLETEDSEDLIANYGLGKSYFDLEKYESAIPYFEKAVKVKKDYSMAYLYLGKSFEFSEKKELAFEIYQNGIIEASKKGDLMPLKEMEQRRNNLKNSLL